MIRTRSLLIWSQTRYHCATESYIFNSINCLYLFFISLNPLFYNKQCEPLKTKVSFLLFLCIMFMDSSVCLWLGFVKTIKHERWRMSFLLKECNIELIILGFRNRGLQDSDQKFKTEKRSGLYCRCSDRAGKRLLLLQNAEPERDHDSERSGQIGRLDKQYGEKTPLQIYR